MKIGGTTLARLGAEFVVIVVGVLVALLAESWWQARQDRELEWNTLLRIREDVRSHQGFLGDIEVWLAQGIPAAGRVPELLAGTEPLSPSDLAVFYSAAVIYVVDRPVGTWDDLLGSGRTTIVTDPRLRQLINAYYRELQDLDAVKESFGMDYRETLLAHLPVEYVREVLVRCVRSPGEMVGPNQRGFDAILQCDVEPPGGTERWGRELRAIPGLARQARLRHYDFRSVQETLRRVTMARDSLLAGLDAMLGP